MLRHFRASKNEQKQWGRAVIDIQHEGCHWQATWRLGKIEMGGHPSLTLVFVLRRGNV
jgi:hypothetical protein